MTPRVIERKGRPPTPWIGVVGCERAERGRSKRKRGRKGKEKEGKGKGKGV